MSRGYGSRRIVLRNYRGYKALRCIRPNQEGTTGG